MIDRPDQVGRLMERLSAALPIPARATPELQATLREQRGVAPPATCRVTWISYAGEEGGIVCKLEATSDRNRCERPTWKSVSVFADAEDSLSAGGVRWIKPVIVPCISTGTKETSIAVSN